MHFTLIVWVLIFGIIELLSFPSSGKADAEKACIDLPPSELTVAAYNKAEEEVVLSDIDFELLYATKKHKQPNVLAHEMLIIESPLHYDIKVSHRAVKSENGLICDAPISVSILVGIEKRFHILKKSAQGNPCSKAEIRKHAENHGIVDDKMISAFLRAIDEPLLVTLGKLKRSPSINEAVALKRFGEGLNDFASRALRALQKERLELHEAIDFQDKGKLREGDCKWVEQLPDHRNGI